MIKVIIIFQHRGKYHEKILGRGQKRPGTENGEVHGHSQLMVGRISVIDMSAIPKF